MLAEELAEVCAQYPRARVSIEHVTLEWSLRSLSIVRTYYNPHTNELYIYV